MAMSDTDFLALLRDLGAEADELIETLAAIDQETWQVPTPAHGWNIHDQVVHLAYFDDLVGLGFTDPDGFSRRKSELLAMGSDWVDRLSWERATLTAAETVEWLATSRAAAIRMFTELGPAARSPWFGPPMSAASSATARLMETWAHGQDVYDTLGVEHTPTDRLKHICHLGVITRGFSYRLRGAEPPPEEVRVELGAPGGDTWIWGPPDAPDRVTGQANDFALAVTQRRNLADTGLAATAGAATEWMSLAQAFAGAAGTGRPAGGFSREVSHP